MPHSQIFPFQVKVNASGQAIVNVGHNMHGLEWKVYQLGFGLGILAPSPQVAAHVNGIPLATTVPMQPTVFSSISGAAPFAMGSFMVGPPYPVLQAGDLIVVGLIAAAANDLFTVGAYVSEAPTGTFAMG